jgi:post-segregation antitoxin (ccd killing protein)
MVIFDFKTLIYTIKKIMKKDLTVSLSPELIKIMKDNFINRSKFIEYCIINELSKNEEFKKELEKLK